MPFLINDETLGHYFSIAVKEKNYIDSRIHMTLTTYCIILFYKLSTIQHIVTVFGYMCYYWRKQTHYDVPFWENIFLIDFLSWPWSVYDIDCNMTLTVIWPWVVYNIDFHKTLLRVWPRAFNVLWHWVFNLELILTFIWPFSWVLHSYDID